jgi:hypothetical protein
LDPAHLPYAHYGLVNAPKPQGILMHYVPFFDFFFCHDEVYIIMSQNLSAVKSDREGGGPIDLSVKKLDSQGFFENQDHFGDTKFIAPCISYASSSPGDAPEKVSIYY